MDPCVPLQRPPLARLSRGTTHPARREKRYPKHSRPARPPCTASSLRRRAVTTSLVSLSMTAQPRRSLRDAKGNRLCRLRGCVRGCEASLLRRQLCCAGKRSLRVAEGPWRNWKASRGEWLCASAARTCHWPRAAAAWLAVVELSAGARQLPGPGVLLFDLECDQSIMGCKLLTRLNELLRK